MSHHDDDIVTNVSTNAHINELVEQRLADPARRRTLKGGLGLAALSFVGAGSAASLASFGGDDDDPAPTAAQTPAPLPAPSRPASLGFDAVAKSVADTVAVPAGYTATVLYALGDPIATNVGPYKNDGTDAATSFAYRAGDHHDGMHYFGLGSDGKYSASASDRGLLCLNHEAITPLFLHPTGPTISGTGAAAARTLPDEVLREYYLHGVSVVQVNRNAQGQWTYAQGSAFNRRVHTLTDLVLSGPAAGTSYMVTKYSPNGTRTRGTVNNCANGYTPWGTYLTCEENWFGYFRRITATDNANRNAKELVSLARYSVAGNGRELWATVTPDTPDNMYGRWIAEVTGATPADDYRNGPNTYGWNVEIDPFDPNSTPKKRTAMGRFVHEGAVLANPVAGKPLVWYQGCDGRNEYVYKYVSDAAWDPADATRGLAAGNKYLDSGKLYAAKFNADGTGTWVLIDISVDAIKNFATYAFADQADVLINTRLAADAVGATKMDRPEWAAFDPVTGGVYMAMTNNSASLRTLAATDAANPRHYNDIKGDWTNQYGNPNGHIIRWKEVSPEATSINWDIFLFGARSTADASNVNISGLTADNDFSSPDGLWFSHATNICWIQTDDSAYTDVTNCMLLAALPGQVGDGAVKSITNTDSAGATKQVQTFVGASLPSTKLRRFLVGPVDCEITGLTESPDGKALFVNIQHPGENTPTANLATPSSSWPSTTPGSRPRSATLVITKNDGGVIGA